MKSKKIILKDTGSEIFDFEHEYSYEDQKVMEKQSLLSQKIRRIDDIQKRLQQLSQDFIQVQLGAVFEDLEERKQEFRDLHNELRVLQGKSERIYL